LFSDNNLYAYFNPAQKWKGCESQNYGDLCASAFLSFLGTPKKVTGMSNHMSRIIFRQESPDWFPTMFWFPRVYLNFSINLPTTGPVPAQTYTYTYVHKRICIHRGMYTYLYKQVHIRTHIHR
jgi:hypothetical protein